MIVFPFSGFVFLCSLTHCCVLQLSSPPDPGGWQCKEDRIDSSETTRPQVFRDVHVDSLRNPPWVIRSCDRIAKVVQLFFHSRGFLWFPSLIAMSPTFLASGYWRVALLDNPLTLARPQDRKTARDVSVYVHVNSFQTPGLIRSCARFAKRRKLVIHRFSFSIFFLTAMSPTSPSQSSRLALEKDLSTERAQIFMYMLLPPNPRASKSGNPIHPLVMGDSPT